MKPLFHPLQIVYSISRRLGVIDVTWLMHLPKPDAQPAPAPFGYTVRSVTVGELAELRRTCLVDQQVGDYQDFEQPGRKLVGAFCGPRMVAFAWFASRLVAADDNYSRSMHLGTSIDLPDGAAFVYNAWTDPDHRGRRLMATVLRHAIDHRAGGDGSLTTMIDWTNRPSFRAFQSLGMQKLGLVIRIGRGPLQVSLLPRAARRVGLCVAADAPGWKLAW